MPDTTGHVAYHLRSTIPGSKAIYRVLGTAPSANAPHMTTVWVQRVGEQGASPWGPDAMMSWAHQFVACCEHGNPQRTPCETCGDQASVVVERYENGRLVWSADGVVLGDEKPSAIRLLGRAEQIIRELMDLAGDIGSRSSDTLMRAATLLAEIDAL